MTTFWRKGYVQTSLDDLVRESGASRGSLYKTFGDKKAMFIAALDEYASRFEARADEAKKTLPDARSILHSLLTASATRLSSDEAPAGCLRCNSTLEVGGVDPDLDAALADANGRYRQVMIDILTIGVAEGSVSQDQVEALATYYSATVAGMVTMARAGADRKALLQVVDIALSTLPRIVETKDIRSNAVI